MHLNKTVASSHDPHPPPAPRTGFTLRREQFGTAALRRGSDRSLLHVVKSFSPRPAAGARAAREQAPPPPNPLHPQPHPRLPSNRRPTYLGYLQGGEPGGIGAPVRVEKRLLSGVTLADLSAWSLYQQIINYMQQLTRRRERRRGGRGRGGQG